MKYAFYVSNQATTLKRTIQYIVTNKKFLTLFAQFEFVYIDNVKNNELRDLLSLHKIQLIEKDLLTTPKEKKNEIISFELLNYLQLKNVDYLFVFGERLLIGDLLKKYNNKIINFHPALLPSFSGFRAIDKGLEYGSLIIGNTAHFIDEGIDTGSIIMQNIFISRNFTKYIDVLDKQIIMVISIITWINQGRLKVKGRNVNIEKAFYNLQEYIPNIELDI